MVGTVSICQVILILSPLLSITSTDPRYHIRLEKVSRSKGYVHFSPSRVHINISSGFAGSYLLLPSFLRDHLLDNAFTEAFSIRRTLRRSSSETRMAETRMDESLLLLQRCNGFSLFRALVHIVSRSRHGWIHIISCPPRFLAICSWT